MNLKTPSHTKLLILTVVQLLLSCAGLSVEIYSIVFHDHYYWLVDDNFITIILTAIMGVAFISCFFVNLYAFYVWDNLDQFFREMLQLKKPSNENKQVGTFWLKILKCVVIILLILVVAVGVFDFATAKMRFGTEGILQWMRLYKSDVEVKVAIDRLQMSWQCCGHLSFSNWTDQNVEIEPGAIDVQNGNLRYVPFSCCNSSSPRPCIHDKVETPAPDINYRYPEDLTIYSQGCSQLLQVAYEALLTAILSITGIMLICEVSSLICALLIPTRKLTSDKSTLTEGIQQFNKTRLKTANL